MLSLFVIATRIILQLEICEIEKDRKYSAVRPYGAPNNPKKRF